jgi:hypothetical protein
MWLVRERSITNGARMDGQVPYLPQQKSGFGSTLWVLGGGAGKTHDIALVECRSLRGERCTRSNFLVFGEGSELGSQTKLELCRHPLKPRPDKLSNIGGWC